MVSADPSTWFLRFSSNVYNVPNGDGRPWGDGTEMAKREGKEDPWDLNCSVTPLIGGYETMSSIREDLEKAIADVTQNTDPNAHVYIADWRFNPLRDLSRDNVWSTNRPWTMADTAAKDQTAIGFVLRLMQAKIKVRILLWLPTWEAKKMLPASFLPHVGDHFYIANVVQAECKRKGQDDLGVVALDMRVTRPAYRPDTSFVSSHHQKMVIIRAGSVHVAYCGGIDFAFTRRDAFGSSSYATDQPQFLEGDWQSGKEIPAVFQDPADPTHRWPKQASGVDYEALRNVKKLSPKASSDLPTDVFSDSEQMWHDQHVRLQGRIVQTLEEQYCERWKDTLMPSRDGRVFTLGAGVLANAHLLTGQVILSSSSAYDCAPAGLFEKNLTCTIHDLPEPQSVPAVSSPPPLSLPAFPATVQMWRTIPLRPRPKSPFTRGEFTIMAGISNACLQAKELIWIFDQYFFSRPLTRLLNHQLNQNNSLHIIIILPPHADDNVLAEHHARKMALNDLVQGADNAARVGVYNLWHPVRHQGIYCHTKVQMYDRALMVCGSANLNRRSFSCDSEIACGILSSEMIAQHQRRLWNVLFPGIQWPKPDEVDFSKAGWGHSFFSVFQKVVQANAQSVYLIPDIWQQEDPNPPVTTSTYSTFSALSNMPIDLTRATVTVTSPQLPNSQHSPREQDYPDDFDAYVRSKLGNNQPPLGDIAISGQKEQESFPTELELDPTSLATGLTTLTPKSETPVLENGVKRECRLDEIVLRIEAPDAKGQWPRR
jgi:phosphatidylserine/phosphatidylglycerophosphate/cardiolipin synthase-like enzyme